MSVLPLSCEVDNTNSFANKSGNVLSNGSVVSAIATDATHTNPVHVTEITERQLPHKPQKIPDKKHIVECTVHLTRSTYYFEEAIEGYVEISAARSFHVDNIHLEIIGGERVSAMVDEVEESTISHVQFGLTRAEHVYYRELLTLAGNKLTHRGTFIMGGILNNNNSIPNNTCGANPSVMNSNTTASLSIAAPSSSSSLSATPAAASSPLPDMSDCTDTNTKSQSHQKENNSNDIKDGKSRNKLADPHEDQPEEIELLELIKETSQETMHRESKEEAVYQRKAHKHVSIVVPSNEKKQETHLSTNVHTNVCDIKNDEEVYGSVEDKSSTKNETSVFVDVPQQEMEKVTELQSEEKEHIQTKAGKHVEPEFATHQNINKEEHRDNESNINKKSNSIASETNKNEYRNNVTDNNHYYLNNNSVSLSNNSSFMHRSFDVRAIAALSQINNNNSIISNNNNSFIAQGHNVITFPAGKYIYPFHFLLPAGLPPSYSTGMCVKNKQYSNSQARVYYYVKVRVLSSDSLALLSSSFAVQKAKQSKQLQNNSTANNEVIDNNSFAHFSFAANNSIISLTSNANVNNAIETRLINESLCETMPTSHFQRSHKKQHSHLIAEARADFVLRPAPINDENEAEAMLLIQPNFIPVTTIQKDNCTEPYNSNKNNEQNANDNTQHTITQNNIKKQRKTHYSVNVQCRYPITGSADCFCGLCSFTYTDNNYYKKDNSQRKSESGIVKGNSRTLIVHFSLNQRLFQLNHDTIRLRARLANTSAKAIHGVKIILRQVLTFYTETAQVTIENKLLETTHEEHIEPQTSATIELESDILSEANGVIPSMHTAGLRVRYVIRVELLAHHIELRYYDFHKVRVSDGLCFFNEPIANVSKTVLHSDATLHQLRSNKTDINTKNNESKKSDKSNKNVNLNNKAMNLVTPSHRKHDKASKSNGDCSNNYDDMESDIEEMCFKPLEPGKLSRPKSLYIVPKKPVVSPQLPALEVISNATFTTRPSPVPSRYVSQVNTPRELEEQKETMSNTQEEN